jgi:hypothetical protein
MSLPLFRPFLSRWRHAAAILFALCVAVACGGGGGVDSGGTGAPVQSFTSGRITGFGSIVVNGVHFDDSNASVLDDEGLPHSRTQLKLGMTVDIDAGPIAPDLAGDTLRGVASRISFGSAIDGPVQGVNAAGDTLTVLGQAVNVDADTVLDGLPGGVAGVAAGTLLRIDAFLDPDSGVYTATRIERQASLPAYKLRGRVSGLDPQAKTFKVGKTTISYAGTPAADVPKLVDGTITRVKLMPLPKGSTWSLDKAVVDAKPIPDDTATEIEGYVTGFTSLASFEIDGTRVDASGAHVDFSKGSSRQIADGVRVEVNGRMLQGVLVADKVELKKQGGGEDEAFELRGRIESVNVAQKTFVLRDTAVVHDARTTFIKGDADDLAAGVGVEVKGVLTANGTRVLASRIKFDRKKK